LEVGKLADFIILNQDIMTLESHPEVLNQTLVLQTVLEGEEIYRNPQYIETIRRNNS